MIQDLISNEKLNQIDKISKKINRLENKLTSSKADKLENLFFYSYPGLIPRSSDPIGFYLSNL